MAAAPVGSRNTLAWTALGFAAAVGCCVLFFDWQLGHPLAGFRVEYAGGGSCKLRGVDGFLGLLWFALLGFPAALLAAMHFAGALKQQPRVGAIGLMCSIAMVVFLTWLGYLGPALGICPIWPVEEDASADSFLDTCFQANQGDSLEALTARMAKHGARHEVIGKTDFFFNEHWFLETEVCEVSTDRSKRVTSAFYSRKSP